MAHAHIGLILDSLKHLGTEVDITTTLLTPYPEHVMQLSNIHKLRISLFALYRAHARFYNTSPNKWHTFVRNMLILANRRTKKIKFTYTLTEKDGVPNYTSDCAYDIIKFVNEINMSNYTFEFFPDFKYINCVPSDVAKRVSNFISILQDNVNFKLYTIETKKIQFCTVAEHRIYVKNNGDCYPCCNTGGEIGQDVPEETFLGNIDHRPVSDMSQVQLHVNNPTCNNCTKKFYKLMEY